MSSPPPSHDGPPTPDLGTAGASARREHERRRSSRDRRTREKHPHLGGVLMALRDAPQHETAWRRGADGEARVAAVLARRCSDGVVVLHDRRVPGSRANVDHVAVTPNGVWVIDSKAHAGKVAVERPWFGRARLTVAGRDRSALADGVARQVELVRRTVAQVAPSIPVQGVMCFVDAELPLLGTLTFGDCLLLSPRALARRLDAEGGLDAAAVQALAAQLAKHLVPA